MLGEVAWVSVIFDLQCLVAFRSVRGWLLGGLCDVSFSRLCASCSLLSFTVFDLVIYTVDILVCDKGQG
jgi:hypothetical protein